MSQIVSWGEILWDRFPHGDELGGAPSNVAFHLAAAGHRVALVSRVGDDDDGRRARAALKSAGVSIDFIQTDAERATGEVGVSISANGDATYTLFRDRAWERIACDEREQTLLGGASAFVFGTLAQRTDEGREAHRKAIASLSESAVIICDPNLRNAFSNWDLLHESLASATIVKINEAEARTVEAQFDCENAAAWLQAELGIQLVAETLGANGCRLHANGNVVAHPGFPASPGGDNVGCGDAFTARLAVGAVRREPLTVIAEDANRLAAAVASRIGATPR